MMATQAAVTRRAEDSGPVTLQELAELYWRQAQATREAGGHPTADTDRYREARARFERSHGQIIKEVWGTRAPAALLVTELQPRSRSRFSDSAIFVLHRSTELLPKPTPFMVAFARGDELVARATVLFGASETQRLVVRRVFAAQELLIESLQEFGDTWQKQEAQATARGSAPTSANPQMTAPE